MPVEPVIEAPPRIEPFGERGVLLAWPERIDPATSAAVHACAARLRAAAPAWIEDIVPGYCSLLLVVDAARCIDDGIAPSAVHAWLQAQLSTRGTTIDAPGRRVEIPVVYGGADGPDLAHVAAHAGLSADEVVARHCAVDYPVAMLGFAPGFPYLIGLDPTLATPRRARPRSVVPAGSVGIGGAQTGIYPRSGPGGWQLIGRTHLPLFDPAREPPSLLEPGDRVRFVPVAAHAS